MPLTGAAAARLYDDHVDSVHALIARRVGSDAAPAITAETFKLVLRTWERFDSRSGTERLFIYGAAAATLRQHLDVEREHLSSLPLTVSNNSSDVRDPLVSGPPTSAARVVEHEANQDLRAAEPAGAGADDRDSHERRVMQAVADLAADDRDILLLSLWESCPQSSIAEALDLNVSEVRSALGRIRRELKISVAQDAS